MATARDERKRSIAQSVDWVDTLLDPGVEMVLRNKPRTRRAARVGPWNHGRRPESLQRFAGRSPKDRTAQVARPEQLVFRPLNVVPSPF